MPTKRELEETNELLREYASELERENARLKDKLIQKMEALDAHRQEYIERLSERLDE